MTTDSKEVLADCIGVAAIAIASAPIAASLQHTQAISQPWVVWLFALPFLAGLSLYAWHAGKKTRDWDTRKWGYAAIFTPIAGAVSFTIDIMVGSTTGHYKSLLAAGAHAGSPFGFPMTILICPIGTLVALGGWARCVSLRAFIPQSDPSDD